MKNSPFFRNVLAISILLLSSACMQTAVPAASTTAPTATPSLIALATQESISPAEEPLVVAFARKGDIYLWNSQTRESRMIVQAGDVTTVMMRDDGQVIAFLRRVLVEQPELVEYVSLWAVDRDGENPRELVSADSLRQQLNPGPSDSAAFAQISWIPGTHRLVYSGSKHYLPGQGFTHSKDIYLVDADTGSNIVLAPDVMPDQFLTAWRFVISPDGQQVALISGTALSFLNTDGTHFRSPVLTYPQVGAGDGVLLPNGVWTQDSRAFLFTGPLQSESIFILNYTIWQVPVDGSPVRRLAALNNSHSGSVTFSPDGKQLAFLQDPDWLIAPLAVEAGPLAIPGGVEELFYANPHWSPAGVGFVIRDQNLFRLCPDATRASEVCGDPIPLQSGNGLITSIRWLDDERFLFTGLEPSTLSLGSLDGTIIPIASWTEEDALSGWSYSQPH